MLRIDLLPKSFRIARLNKLMLVGLLVVLGLVAAYWLQTGATINAQIADTERQIASVRDAANQYDQTMAELGDKQAELQPIADKVKFVEDADKSGEIYWELYHKLKRYIWAQARMETFRISPPNACSFTVQVTGTTQYARFLLNLLRCPDLTITSFTVLSAGRGVPSAGQPEPGMWPTARGKVVTGEQQAAPARAGGAGGGVPGMGPVGMGGPGMGGMPGPGGPMMGGGPGGPPGGAPGMGGMPGGGPPGMGGMGPGPGGMGPGPGGMGPMAGMMGGQVGAAGGATTSPDRQPITIQVSGVLSTTIAPPMPPGAAMGGVGGMPGMGGGMMGMGGAPGGMPGMGGAPGGAPGGPGAAPGGAAPAGRGGRRGGEEEESGGGLGRRRGAEGGEE
ncbi:MAG: hypothetical protein N2512_09475 [Armatimonadetes bacterium]|nr:hypothetical protein [Armatimonadota bacterium]